MHDLVSVARRGIAATLLASAAMVPFDTAAAQAATTTPSRLPQGPALMVPAYVPLFATSEDAQAFWSMAVRAWMSPSPDARTAAKAFIKERLGVDGDAYAVAHFATPQMRSAGFADRTILLTDALMQAFPEHSRHTFFGTLADGVSGLNEGGEQSPGALSFAQSLYACKTAGECFSRIGRFLWSRTGPGYIYNTFIGQGNVGEVVHEDRRALDEAFGIYPVTSTLLPAQASSLKLSQVIDKFREEGLFAELPYIKRLKREFGQHWNAVRSDWPLLARYRFVHEARQARGLGVLTQGQYELVMKEGAPNVPLDGLIALQQLRGTPRAASRQSRRFDINGYAASDVVRFVDTDGSQVMYIPGSSSPFVAFGNERELRQWVVRQAMDRASLDELLSHFSLYNRQDGVFWTGVSQGLTNLANATWRADSTTVDHGNTIIAGDIFEDMRGQLEARQRDDARVQTSTAWDAWRATFSRTAAVLGPLGYAPPLAIPVQAGSALFGLGTGLDQAVHGRTARERTSALGQAVMTVVTSVAVAGAMGTHGAQGERTIEPFPPAPLAGTAHLQRVNGRIGYLMGSLKGPGLPTIPEEDEGGQTLGAEDESRISYLMQAMARPGLPVIAEEDEGGQTPGAEGEGENTRLAPAVEEAPRRRVYDPLAGKDARQPPSARSLRERGYLVMTMPPDMASRTRQIIDLKKITIDEMRHRMEDFRTDSLATTTAGSRVSFDQSLVYRVDDRTPQQLLTSGGFGPSMEFHAVMPMLRQPSTIGSGSLMASNLVLRQWQLSAFRKENYHQYAIWTDGRTVAAGSDNNHLISYDTPLDEVHFPADVQTKNIYIIDSFDPVFANALAEIYESRYVSTPYGVPLDAFTEYLAGRLDIDAPSRFTTSRVTPRLPSHTPSPGESGSTIELSHQPLSSSDTSVSGENAPLIRPPNRFSTVQD